MDDSKDGGAIAASSTRPYLIRALHEWCTDNGFTPYVAVHVDRTVQVPMEYVSNNEIVLNVGFDATSNLDLGNELIQFKARFGGVAREIIVPVDHVVAIYARENGQGMAFPPPTPDDSAAAQRPAPGASRGLRLASSDAASDEQPPKADPAAASGASTSPDDDDPGTSPSGGRPALKRIK
ncbi:ClpXP protease specificity-enhancing factor [Roseateles aquatilis]|uniref:ClpXP protease specificity-enhancing factor n=1 Tax=Roseateles aquatilis TaxID=431061 RepID=A0A246JMD2_9BURK|nr:ClpXP protease specificity-enhancing factor [Roseateles aquatilis]OWQ93663.1 ClpXP protease specificity-enhancing factor [Roseateles aquatilis]